jgi:hypothetical protein
VDRVSGEWWRRLHELPTGMLKQSSSFVLGSSKSSTGTRPPHQLGGAHRLGAPYSSHRAPQRVRLGPSLAAALPAEWRVSARPGWVGEMSELFEHSLGECCCRTCADSRSSRVSKESFRYLLGRRRGSSTRLSVAAGAEWVRAPMEMRSGPAAAIARTFFNVIPPDTSTSARPLISRMA